MPALALLPRVLVPLAVLMAAVLAASALDGRQDLGRDPVFTLLAGLAFGTL